MIRLESVCSAGLGSLSFSDDLNLIAPCDTYDLPC